MLCIKTGLLAENASILSLQESPFRFLFDYALNEYSFSFKENYSHGLLRVLWNLLYSLPLDWRFFFPTFISECVSRRSLTTDGTLEKEGKSRKLSADRFEEAFKGLEYENPSSSFFI